MEFLLVSFSSEREVERDVSIDGVVAGLTNHLITLAAGSYTISLVAPNDFSPRLQDVVIQDTSPLDPQEIVFV